jgi:hypothetical protein
MADLFKRTVFLTDLAVVPRSLAADDSLGMPQPRKCRSRGTVEVPQAPVLPYAGKCEKQHDDDDDDDDGIQRS